MTVDAPTPLPLRPSEADRDRVARMLRESSVDGRISLDTFSHRLERAFVSRDRAELDELVSDVRPRGRVRAGLMRFVTWWSTLVADLELAWERPRLAPLALPEATAVLGRALSCDCVLSEPSVSRRHAELRRDGDGWLLRDLGSRNGTRVNGLLLLGEARVRPGDRVSFGEARFRLVAPAC